MMMSVHGAASEERRWSDLPGDLLGAIYLRSASAYDRARFAAVCSPWRAAAAWHPRLPVLPLLLLSTGGHGKRDREARAYSPEDGRALRVPLPWFPWGNRLVGSYPGGWIATVSGSDELLVVNLFTGSRKVLTSCGISIRKIVFSKDPSSGSCILVAMAAALGPYRVAARMVNSPHTRWTTELWAPAYGDLVDIAFCNGELYGITLGGGLMVFEVHHQDKGGGLPAIPVLPSINVRMNSLHTTAVKYIFELHDKVAIAVEVEPEHDSSRIGHSYRVFELADTKNDTPNRYTWAEVTSLGDHTLFLGPGCCKAVPVAATAGRRGRVEGNSIYFSKQHTYLHNKMESSARLEIGSGCVVHCWESENEHRIMSRGYHYRKDQERAEVCNGCLWLWPPDF